MKTNRVVITKISISNYRGCIDTVFEPHERLSALIGPNGSGKTSVLLALKLIEGLVSGSTRPNARFRHDYSLQTTECSLETEYLWDGKKIKHFAKIKIYTNEKNVDEIIDSSETWYSYDVTGTRRKFDLSLEVLFEWARYSKYTSREERVYLGNKQRWRYNLDHMRHFHSHKKLDDASLEAFSDVAVFASKVTYYSASQFTNPSNCPVSFEVQSIGRAPTSKLPRWTTGRARRGHRHEAFLIDVYNESENKTEVFSEFINLVGPDGIGLIEDFKFERIETSSINVKVNVGGSIEERQATKYVVIPKIKVGNNTLSPSQLSEGTFKTLALVFHLVNDNSSVLMIEEPEVCVHQGLIDSIIEIIQSYSIEKQIVISTHSDSVLDSLDVDNIFSVKRGEVGAVVKKVSKSMKSSELSALQEYLRTEGSLGEFWKHGDLEIE